MDQGLGILDSEAAGMSNRPSHTPVDVLDKSSLALMNLNVVKRIDPETEQVLLALIDTGWSQNEVFRLIKMQNV